MRSAHPQLDLPAALDALARFCGAIHAGRLLDAAGPRQRREDLGIMVSSRPGRSQAARKAASASTRVAAPTDEENESPRRLATSRALEAHRPSGPGRGGTRIGDRTNAPIS